jgi:hypothetical protein
MNRFVSTALALAAVGSAANAGTGDNEWLELDSEINGLASTLQPSQDGTGWAALIRAVYTHSSDDIATGGGSDVSGFNFNDVDLAFWGSQGPYMWRISTDIDSNEAGVASSAEFTLEDAYVAWDCGGYFRAQMGQFKPRSPAPTRWIRSISSSSIARSSALPGTTGTTESVSRAPGSS